MYGVAATRRRTGEEGTPPWVPDGALAHLDFVNGQYYAGGSTWAVASLLGGGFDAGDIDANGMACWYTNSNRPTAAGAFLSVLQDNLAAGMSLIVELDSPSAEGNNVPIILLFDTDPDTYGWLLQMRKSGATQVSIQDDDGLVGGIDGLNLAAPFAEWNATGINRIGFTLGRDLGGGSWRYAASVNGGTAQTQDRSYSPDEGFATAGLGEACIGAVSSWVWAMDYSYFRSITVYAAVDETTLEALTEPVTA